MGQDCCSNREKIEKDAQGNVIRGKNNGNPNEGDKNGDGANKSVKEKLTQVGTSMKNYDYKGAADTVKNYDYKKAAEDTKSAVANYDYKKAAQETQDSVKNYDYKGAADAVKTYDYKGALDNAKNHEYTKGASLVFSNLKTTVQTKINDQKERAAIQNRQIDNPS